MTSDLCFSPTKGILAQLLGEYKSCSYRCSFSYPESQSSIILCFANYLTLACLCNTSLLPLHWHCIASFKLTDIQRWMNVCRLSAKTQLPGIQYGILNQVFKVWFFHVAGLSLWGFSVTENSNVKTYCPKEQACKLHDFYRTSSKIKVLQSVWIKMPQMFVMVKNSGRKLLLRECTVKTGPS